MLEDLAKSACCLVPKYLQVHSCELGFVVFRRSCGRTPEEEGGRVVVEVVVPSVFAADAVVADGLDALLLPIRRSWRWTVVAI